MSIDIHVCVEKLFQDQWVLVRRIEWAGEGPQPLAIRRNYRRFAELGCPDDYRKKSVGLPTNVSVGTQAYVAEWVPDAHSHSWLSLEDACGKWLQTESDPVLVDAIASDFELVAYDYFLVELMDGENVADYRVVYWFDS